MYSPEEIFLVLLRYPSVIYNPFACGGVGNSRVRVECGNKSIQTSARSLFTYSSRFDSALQSMSTLALYGSVVLMDSPPLKKASD